VIDWFAIGEDTFRAFGYDTAGMVAIF